MGSVAFVLNISTDPEHFNSVTHQFKWLTQSEFVFITQPCCGGITSEIYLIICSTLPRLKLNK